MGFLKNLFSENTSVSCMRVLSVISLLAAVGIAYISLYKGCTLDNATGTLTIFVGAAFGGKIWQKAYEKGKDE